LPIGFQAILRFGQLRDACMKLARVLGLLSGASRKFFVDGTQTLGFRRDLILHRPHSLDGLRHQRRTLLIKPQAFRVACFLRFNLLANRFGFLQSLVGLTNFFLGSCAILGDSRFLRKQFIPQMFEAASQRDERRLLRFNLREPAVQACVPSIEFFMTG
jgi:hypothetical protein